MPNDPQSKPSFSVARKWSIGLNVVLLTIFVFAVVVMVNYLSRDYFYRFHVDSRTRLQLSPYTVGLLKSITNRVNITIYYNKENGLYTMVSDLLTEYRLANPRISVRTVDYLTDPTAAREVQNTFKLGMIGDKDLGNKNLIIFECDKRAKAVPGEMIAKYVQERVPNEKEIHMLRKPVEFLGERAFDGALLSVVSPRPSKAYFAMQHGEHRIDDNQGLTGYSQLAALLIQNNVQPLPLPPLLGTNRVPADCDLLVIGGPSRVLPDFELEKIQQYLAEGGRALVLFDNASATGQIGLENLLAQWGVDVGTNRVIDPENSYSQSAEKSLDVVVSDFSRKHAMTAPFVGSDARLQLLLPRSIRQLRSRAATTDAPAVEELAFTGPHAQILEIGKPPGPQQKISLIAAVEKGAIKDVKNERGTTRLVVAGDATFLANRLIDQADNRTFAENAVNWLLDRTEFVQGPPPQAILTYKVLMTSSQMRSAKWLLLGAFPGAVLLFGGLVWLRRRH
jgi:ABC-type uncharacterized transport system involved in gliding motility auxiliary subunit